LPLRNLTLPDETSVLRCDMTGDCGHPLFLPVIPAKAEPKERQCYAALDRHFIAET
jgi:hypothetical protein